MMKISHITPAGLISLLATLTMFAGIARAEESNWNTDFEAAKSQAKAEKKLLLVDFTGSDWCGWCIKLRNEVFELDAFKNEAPKQFVLVELDYPKQKKLPDELKAQNTKLAKEYKIKGYPTILLMDVEGKVIAHTGYRPNGPEKYMEHLGDLQKTWESVLKWKTELAGVLGLDRAKLLDQLVEAYENKLNNPIDELNAWSEEIISLDADNKAGLKNKYVCRAILADAEKLGKERKFAEAVAALEKALALEGLPAERKQEVLFHQGMFQFNLKDFAAALETMKKADKIEAEGDLGPQIKGRITMLARIVEGLANIDKDKGALEKAEGIDRAKLLDKLIQANIKLQMYGAAKLTPDEVAKWTAEIVELDADNAAGLKNKYEFTKLLSEAGSLAREKKFDEGLAAIDKALALSGITPEQTQEGLMAKGTNYLAQKNFEKSIESFKKAQEAAPQGPRFAILNYFIKNAEQQQKKAAEQSKKEEPKKEEAK